MLKGKLTEEEGMKFVCDFTQFIKSTTKPDPEKCTNCSEITCISCFLKQSGLIRIEEKDDRVQHTNPETKLGGGHYVCSKCGETVFGSALHRCSKSRIKSVDKKDDRVSEEWAEKFLEDGGEPIYYIKDHIAKLKQNNRICLTALEEAREKVNKFLIAGEIIFSAYNENAIITKKDFFTIKQFIEAADNHAKSNS